MKANLTSKQSEAAILVSLISVFFAKDWNDIPTIRTRELNGGYGISVEFGNGYSGDVVCHEDSCGGDENLWELAVVFDHKIVYDTPITDDVIGYMDKEEVIETLIEIKNLPSREEEAA